MGMSEQRWNEGKCRRRGEEGGGYRSRALVCQHFPRSDTILLLDNKFDLISIVLQVLLGYRSERQAKGGVGWKRRHGINKK